MKENTTSFPHFLGCAQSKKRAREDTDLDIDPLRMNFYTEGMEFANINAVPETQGMSKKQMPQKSADTATPHMDHDMVDLMGINPLENHEDIAKFLRDECAEFCHVTTEDDTISGSSYDQAPTVVVPDTSGV